MGDQPRYDTYAPSAFFADAMSARPLPDGVVPRPSPDDVEDSNGPPALTIETLREGRRRYDIYCAPCHGFTGAGDGIVALRGLRTQPPSFHSGHLRSVDMTYLVEVIRNGAGAMPSYAYQVRPRERWAIAAYIRALQLSRWADVDWLDEAEQRRLDEVAQ
jgi:mono/diheme cytochrome c family protein